MTTATPLSDGWFFLVRAYGEDYGCQLLLAINVTHV